MAQQGIANGAVKALDNDYVKVDCLLHLLISCLIPARWLATWSYPRRGRRRGGSARVSPQMGRRGRELPTEGEE